MPTRLGPFDRLVVAMTIVVIATIGGCWNQNSAPSQRSHTRQAEIVGSSMAPHFLGDHYRCQCEACSFEFVGAIIEPEQTRKSESVDLVCPNCGFQTSAQWDALSITPRDKTQIRSLDSTGDTPLSRWSVLAVQDPEFEQPSIKRLIGLPGEWIRFEDGNVFASVDEGKSWQLIRKPLAWQRQLSILVHDSHYSDGSVRWVAANTQPVAGKTWYTFAPRRCIGREDAQTTANAVPIEDYYASNYSVTRQLNATDELFVDLELNGEQTAKPGSALEFEFDLRGIRHQIEIAFNENTIRVNSIPTQQQPTEISFDWRPAEAFTIQASVIDRQLILTLDGKQLIDQPIKVGAAPVSRSPIRIGLTGTFKTWIKRARVYRDLYYLPSPLRADVNGVFQQTPLVAGKGYLVIGDNVPVSFDSRFWTPASIPEKNIIGIIEKD